MNDQKPVIDPEFRKLSEALPLSQHERTLLEASLKHEGCRNPLVVWKEQRLLLDGHNRLAICDQYGISYRCIELSLPDRASALHWTICNHLGRTNLTAYQKFEVVGSLEESLRQHARQKQQEAGGALPQKSAKPPIDTREELAEACGVSHDTISKMMTIREFGSAGLQDQLRSGEISINKAHRSVMKEIRRQENGSDFSRLAAEMRAPIDRPSTSVKKILEKGKAFVTEMMLLHGDVRKALVIPDNEEQVVLKALCESIVKVVNEFGTEWLTSIESPTHYRNSGGDYGNPCAN